VRLDSLGGREPSACRFAADAPRRAAHDAWHARVVRIAVVSDVHGNLTALEAVVADLAQRGPDLVVHGGDLAPDSPHNASSFQPIPLRPRQALVNRRTPTRGLSDPQSQNKLINSLIQTSTTTAKSCRPNRGRSNVPVRWLNFVDAEASDLLG
jgi:hypothetical protein